ncbi:MAG: hypothetical protein ACRCYY_15270 [Trueperaceae bacterium]
MSKAYLLLPLSLLLLLSACNINPSTNASSGTSTMQPNINDTNVTDLTSAEVKNLALDYFPIDRIVSSLPEEEHKHILKNDVTLSAISEHVRIGEPIRARSLVELDEQTLSDFQTKLVANYQDTNLTASDLDSLSEANSFLAKQQLASIKVNMGDIYYVPVFVDNLYVASIQTFALSSKSIGSSATLLGPTEKTTKVFKVSREEASTIGGSDAELVIVPSVGIYWLSGKTAIDTHTGEIATFKDEKGQVIDISSGIKPHFDEAALRQDNLPVKLLVTAGGE